MAHFAGVNSEGVVLFTQQTPNESHISEGMVERGITFHRVPDDVDGIVVTGSWYWNDGWHVRDAAEVEAARLERNLEGARAYQLKVVSEACRATILSGFDHNGFHYPFKETDQMNLTACVLDSMMPSDIPDDQWTTEFWCASNFGAAAEADQGWEFRHHTRSEIQAVGAAGKNHKVSAMTKAEGLSRLIKAYEGTDVEEIRAIK